MIIGNVKKLYEVNGNRVSCFWTCDFSFALLKMLENKDVFINV